MSFPYRPYRPTEPGQPCNVCGHPRDREKGSGPAVQITWLEHLEASAQRACPLCLIIVLGIERCLGRESIRVLGDTDTTLKLEFNMTRTPSLHVTSFKASESVSFVISPESPLLDNSCFISWSPGHHVPSSTDSEESLGWVLDRIRECDSTHRLCTPTSEPSLPKRVIDLGTSNSQIKLRVTEENTPGRYICLSHRWAMPTQHPLRRTLSNNISSHRQGISWDGLPATFRDAIDFTRALGIRYLWIDSMCIIQDDLDDWRREGAKMASTYSNAYLTLAAAQDRGSERSMFVRMDPKFRLRPLALPESLLKDLGLSHRPHGASDYGVYVRHPLTHIVRHTHLRPTLRQPLPLLQRGWVFQERLLSPRTLYFGPEELSWECVEHHKCQCTGTRSSTHSTQTNPKKVHRPSTLQQLAAAKGLHAVANRWAGLVEEYTALDLTFESDIFPALSGLAKSYRSILGSRYCAGLWERFLHEGLLWHVAGGTMDQDHWAQARRPGLWRAPSWSWAAVKGPVEFTRCTVALQEKCEVLDANCTLAGPDPTGELLSGGYLVLRGLVVSTRLRYVDLTKGSSRSSPLTLFRLVATEPLVERFLIVTTFADINYMFDDPLPIPSGSEVACFLVGARDYPETYDFLVLKLSSASSASMASSCSSYPTYERIGLVQIQGPPHSSRTASSFITNWVKEHGEERTIKLI
ncbi:HET-domain-containing protein [Sodiomyces alkalinus F11]|uniref:HET-domain-containing protein n=1 Tax=Sodiomyces alkalinus (strain CBS 110278 / VKM F-3762 / F11) TaxID=1314773 RepID=A0A3N2PRP5_SODAK|nr:HET-domain-containing protein [Sodiomyces alkalinus F11]ROT37165.1 HET-domain-containing protein [Sodiomyces alkalinus F11]